MMRRRALATVFLSVSNLSCAFAADYRLHEVPTGLNGKASPPSGAEDVRSFDKPLLNEPIPRASNKTAAVVSACASSSLSSLARPAAQQQIANALQSTQARECFADLLKMDETTVAPLFHHGQLDHSVTKLTSDNLAIVLAAVYHLRAAFYLRHQFGLSFYQSAQLPIQIESALQRWNVSADDTVAKSSILDRRTLAAELLLLADSARVSSALIKSVLATLSDSDRLIKHREGRRQLFAAQVLIQRWQHDPALPLNRADSLALLSALDAMLSRHHSLFGAEASYLLNNALSLMAGFARSEVVRGHVSTALKNQFALLTTESTLITSLQSQRQINKAWARAADIASQWMPERCTELALCDLFAAIQAKALPITQRCSDTLLIRAQDMTADQLQQSCQRLLPIEQQFHQQLATQREQLSGDRNTHLEVIIFDDWSEYDIYATALYQISSNNGGMYLEGKPEKDGNQARFVSHEADWLRPQFVVWNLEHEYVHYLDGRFNVAGDYEDSLPWPLVWWQEGVAEYFAKGDDSADAMAAQQKRQLSLSTIFSTPVEPWDVERVYKLGYLAARYMIQQQPGTMQRLRELLRSKQFAEYQAVLSRAGQQHDASFQQWWHELATQTASNAASVASP